MAKPQQRFDRDRCTYQRRPINSEQRTAPPHLYKG